MYQNTVRGEIVMLAIYAIALVQQVTNKHAENYSNKIISKKS